MSSALRIYLRNHEAAARAGMDLCRRAARNQADSAHGPALAELYVVIQEDRKKLLSIMQDEDVRPNSLLGLTLQAGERLGRLKPNGRLLRRSPLSDLIEIEGLVDAVSAKRAGWYALAARSPAFQPTQVSDLIGRADDQLAQLRPIHATVAAQVLA